MSKEFHNFVFCFSGLSQLQRSQLQNKIQSKGGTVSGPFTNHVTHLVCEKAGSDKFQAAKRLRIKIVKPEFIETGKGELNGDLEGLIVTTSGYSGTELTEIIAKIGELGGIYQSDMSSSTNLLLCEPDAISPKTQAASKWNIQRQEKKFLYEKESKIFENIVVALGSGFNSSIKEYLRKITRFGKGNFMSSYSQMVTHYIVVDDIPESEKETIHCKIVKHTWLSDCFIQNKILSTAEYEVEPAIKKRKDFMDSSIHSSIQPSKKPKAQDVAVDQVQRVFAGEIFQIDGFSADEVSIANQTTTLVQSLELYGGKIVPDGGKLIWPFHIQTQQFAFSEFWIEACIQQNRILPRDESIMYKPTTINLPLANFKYRIGISGFEESDRVWIKRLVTALGGIYTETFSRKNTHLIVKDASLVSVKSQKAKEWEIPIQSKEWLEEFLNPLHEIQNANNSKAKVLEYLDKFNRDNISEKLNYVVNENNESHRSSKILYGDYETDKSTEKLFDSVPNVLLSSIPASKRAEISSSIKKLGGIVLDSNQWIKSCTLLIIEQYLRTEKVLCAIAKCVPQGMFVKEDEYILSDSICLAYLDSNLANAAKHWKQEYETTGKRPFQGWSVYLYCAGGIKESTARLLEAGDAKIVDDQTQLPETGLVLSESGFLKKNPRLSTNMFSVNYVMDYLSSMAQKEVKNYML